MAILHLNEVTVGTAYCTQLNTSAGTGASFLFYTGALPADASVTATGTLLATLTLGAVALGTVTTGISGGAKGFITCNLPSSANGVATGTPGYMRIQTSGAVGVVDLDVTASGGGGSVIMTPNTITSGAPVSLTSCVITAP